jgi:hypothetical protein
MGSTHPSLELESSVVVQVLMEELEFYPPKDYRLTFDESQPLKLRQSRS